MACPKREVCCVDNIEGIQDPMVPLRIRVRGVQHVATRNFLTQERLGVIETRKKPRITLSRFLDWLDDELETLL